MASEATDTQGKTPFEIIGGAAAVARIVDAFYDLVEGDPAYRALRAMHAANLEPVRASLTGFLTAWLGGPRDWFTDNPGKCIMSAHAPFDITQPTVDQWVGAMERALATTETDPALASAMGKALARMAQGMLRGN